LVVGMIHLQCYLIVNANTDRGERAGFSISSRPLKVMKLKPSELMHYSPLFVIEWISELDGPQNR
jgi:hypothetical protein